MKTPDQLYDEVFENREYFAKEHKIAWCKIFSDIQKDAAQAGHADNGVETVTEKQLFADWCKDDISDHQDFHEYIVNRIIQSGKAMRIVKE